MTPSTSPICLCVFWTHMRLCSDFETISAQHNPAQSVFTAELVVCLLWDACLSKRVNGSPSSPWGLSDFEWQQRAAGLSWPSINKPRGFICHGSGGPLAHILWLYMVLNEWDSDNIWEDLWTSEVLMVQESKGLWCGEQFECRWSLCFIETVLRRLTLWPF